MTHGHEKRQSPRRLVNLKVQHRDPKTNKTAADYARDLSKNGIFVRTKRHRPVGATLEIMVAASPDPREHRYFKALCEVVRVTPEGIGLAFKSLDAESGAILSGLLATLKY